MKTLKLRSVVNIKVAKLHQVRVEKMTSDNYQHSFSKQQVIYTVNDKGGAGRRSSVLPLGFHFQAAAEDLTQGMSPRTKYFSLTQTRS